MTADVRPLNQLAEDGDLTFGNSRDSTSVLDRRVVGRHDVHARDGAHHWWNMLRWIAEICGLVAMAPSLQHL